MSERTDSPSGTAGGGEPAPQPRRASTTDEVAPVERPAGNASGSANRRRGGGAATAERVGSIVAAAETAAEQIRLRTEARMRDRIAEGDRAAENRIRAAEAEAIDIVRQARAEAEQAKTVAASEALGILAKAHEDADRTRAEAEAVKTTSTALALELLAKSRQEAEAGTTKAKAQSREILGEARVATADVRSEGMELVQNLREMGDSLRSNAELLLGDIQAVHARMSAQLDRVDGGASGIRTPRTTDRASAPGATTRESAPERRPDGGELEIPEFIPPA